MYKFTNDQLTILSWFNRNAPSLGELYEGAIRLLYEVRIPGHTRYISHSVREIRNRIPEVLAGVKGVGQLQYKNRLDSIVKMWSTKGLLVKGEVMNPSQSTAEPNDEDIYVPIPVDIVNEFKNLLNDHVTVSESRVMAAKRLFQAASNAKIDDIGRLDPTIRNWLSITDWFMSHAHDCGEIDSTIDYNKLCRKFEGFETILNVLVGHFFSTTDELDEILQKTNR